MTETVTGGCLCGAVRYRAGLPALFCSHCHCRFCRRAHGAAFVTWFGVPEAAFEDRSEASALRWYRSSEQSRRGFCGRCGTTLLFASAASSLLVFALATADGPIGLEPQGHIFFDHHVPWFEPGDALPRIDSDAEALARYRTIGT